MSLPDDGFGIMLGHYFFFLKFTTDNLIVYISVIYATWNKLQIPQPSGYRFDTAPTLLMAWLCTKYHWHAPFEALLFASGRLIMPICTFYELVTTGEFVISMSRIHVSGS